MQTEAVELPAAWWELLDVEMLASALARLRLPDVVIDAALRTRGETEAAALAANPTLSPAVLRALAENTPEYRVLRTLAANPSAPADLLAVLAGHDVAIVMVVARNGACPQVVLEQLARHEDHRIRRQVAANPASLPALLSTLLEDSTAEVAAAAVANRSTPMEIAATYPSKRSVLAAAWSRRVLSEDPSPTRPVVFSDVFVLAGRESPPVPPEVQRHIAEHTNTAIRLTLAANPTTDPSLLAPLSRDPVQVVRLAAVTNGATPLGVLAALRPGDVHVGETAYLACRVLDPVFRAHPEVVEPVAALLAGGFTGTYAELGVAAAATL